LDNYAEKRKLKTKNINMKQLLSLALALLPCLAWAQYPINGNQKITLGEQTTADGLIYRGVLADTGIITPSSDTSAYIILDTVNHRFYNYNRATNVWSMAGVGSISSGLTGVLPVANGGTNATTLNANKVMVGNGTSGVLTPTNLHWNNAISYLGIGTASPSQSLHSTGSILTNGGIFINAGNPSFIMQETDIPDKDWDFQVNSGNFLFFEVTDGRLAFTQRLSIRAGGQLWVGNTSTYGNYLLQVKDSLYVNGNVSAAAYITRSDYNLKDDIFNLKYGLNDVLKLQPVEYIYKSNGSKQLGFIAQDIGTILPEVVSFEESMSVNYQAIIPILTKAIQEQQALIKSLEQRIINLENK
jgi:hypothetical protein